MILQVKRRFRWVPIDRFCLSMDWFDDRWSFSDLPVDPESDVVILLDNSQ